MPQYYVYTYIACLVSVKKNTHSHTHTHICIYIYIYIYMLMGDIYLKLGLCPFFLGLVLFFYLLSVGVEGYR